MARQFLLKRETLISADIHAAWAFFSNPENLAKLSPEYLHFQIIHCPETKEVYTGMKIEYKVSPLMKIPMKWESLIQDVIPLRQFKDIQTKGPYKVWEHTHLFESTENGVLMKDNILYEMPFGFLGNWANRLFVAKQLNELFDYRTEKIKMLFP
ncbi:SRPBCC family protein [Taibaiella lutea]|uniref:SRPBCC family protein n=1 Tax=Taibaiella lutea TaxID=2608001 RepID=A0A5M6CHD1_9BACT|nr:SRPBCC family protein [Taibaiella lutea]KAA5534447.1 SRPBCC family protein [Taibaiella lutea]